MRILHLTDTHLGAWLSVLGAPPGWQRAHDHQLALELALEPALRQEVDLVVHSGDVFDRSQPPPAAMAAFARLLVRVARRVPVLVMPGNHDRRGLMRSLPWRAPGLTVMDRPGRYRLRDLDLGVMPFRRLPEQWAEEARKVACPLMVAHQAFHGATVPGLVFRVGQQRDTLGPQHLPSELTHVLCGHIHPRQVTVVAGTTVVQPGSTERTAFSERQETKGYALWELGARIRWRFVDLPSRPMVVVDKPQDLRGITPGSLARTSLPPELALERGAWVVGRHRERARASPQLRLFASRRRGAIPGRG